MKQGEANFIADLQRGDHFEEVLWVIERLSINLGNDVTP